MSFVLFVNELKLNEQEKKFLKECELIRKEIQSWSYGESIVFCIKPKLFRLWRSNSTKLQYRFVKTHISDLQAALLNKALLCRKLNSAKSDYQPTTRLG